MRFEATDLGLGITVVNLFSCQYDIMKSTRFIVQSVPYGLGGFLFLSVIVFSTFIFAVIEANPNPNPSIVHGHLPKIKIKLPFKLTKPHYRKINLGGLSKPLKRFRDDGHKFRENYKESLRSSYSILQGKI